MNEDEMVISKSKEKLYCYRQYRNWPDGERWELIEGEAFNMSPAPGMTHQKISGNIFRIIANYLEDKPCQVFSAPFDVFLPEQGESEEEIRNIVQPDLSIICDESKLSEKGCTGAPDTVIEIISPSTASRDQITKLRLYEKHGVKEYWIIHPVDRIVWKYILKKGVFDKPELFDYTGKPAFSLLPDLEINLYKIFDLKKEDFIREPSPSSYRH